MKNVAILYFCIRGRLFLEVKGYYFKITGKGCSVLRLCHCEAHFAEAIPTLHTGDCFVPLNDMHRIFITEQPAPSTYTLSSGRVIIATVANILQYPLLLKTLHNNRHYKDLDKQKFIREAIMPRSKL